MEQRVRWDCLIWQPRESGVGINQVPSTFPHMNREKYSSLAILRAWDNGSQVIKAQKHHHHSACSIMRPLISTASRRGPLLCRTVMMSAMQPSGAKKEGDISDAFASLAGIEQTPLPDRFRQLKCDLVKGNETRIQAAWAGLLEDLKKENRTIAKERSNVIPEIEFEKLESGLDSIHDEV